MREKKRVQETEIGQNDKCFIFGRAKCEVGMMGRSQKRGGSEKEILYCIVNEEPLKDFKEKRNIGVTC